MSQKVSVIRTTCCRNGVCEKTKFFAEIAERSTSRRERRKACDRAAKNTASSVRTLGRTLNHWFKRGDLVQTFTFNADSRHRLEKRAEELKRKYMDEGKENPDERDILLLAAAWEAENFIRRCQYAAGKQKIEFRYVLVESDVDGKTGETVRPHLHLVVNREMADICRDKWGYGFDYEKHLYSWCPKRGDGLLRSGRIPDPAIERGREQKTVHAQPEPGKTGAEGPDRGEAGRDAAAAEGRRHAGAGAPTCRACR